jgi:hypothetical protein
MSWSIAPSRCVRHSLIASGYHPFDRQLTTWESYRAVFGIDTFCERYEPYYSFVDSKFSRFREDHVTKLRIKTGLHHIDFEGSDVWDTMYDGARQTTTAPPFLAHARLALIGTTTDP